MEQQESVVDWRPGRAETTIWNVVAIVLIALGLPLFALPSVLLHGPAGASFRVGLTEILLVVAVTAVLLVVHEGIHGLVMLAFRAHPSFGVVLVGGAMPALYATSVGHRFSRGQYLAVAATPAVVISVLGFLLCFGPWGGYLIVPLATPGLVYAECAVCEVSGGRDSQRNAHSATVVDASLHRRRA